MKKAKLIVTTLCMVAAFTLVMPATTAYASDPQGTSNSAPKPPPPPTVDWIAIAMALMKIY